MKVVFEGTPDEVRAEMVQWIAKRKQLPVQQAGSGEDGKLPEWTGFVVAVSHTNRISMQELADAVGWNHEYLREVLNGRRTPPGAEDKVTTALLEMVKKKENEGHCE